MNTSVFQRIDASGISFSITANGEQGFLLKMGDPVRAEACVRDWDNVADWLCQTALQHYPDSGFACHYRDVIAMWNAPEMIAL